jgi:hypothetical protein
MAKPDRKPLTPEELAEDQPDQLPAREAMSLVNPSFVTINPHVDGIVSREPTDPPMEDPGTLEDPPA